MNELILHHYDASPFTQKALLMLGIKGLSWHSVETPMMPPKPDLVALTGGYRGTPVLQIGAHVYIDTQRIARELDQRFPEHALIPPDQAGLALALVKWSELFFRSALHVIIDQTSAHWGDEFLEDRKYLFWDIDFDNIKDIAGHSAAQFRAHASLVNDQLADGRAFLAGDEPTLYDVQAWPFFWIARAGIQNSGALLADLKALLPWEERMAAIGDGQRSIMAAEEALGIAREATPDYESAVDAADAGGLQVGQHVRIEPEDTRRGAVDGELVAAHANEVVIRRSGDRVGKVMVHYPRLGYKVTALD